MYSFDSRVRYSECDETGRLSLVGMMNYLQDCSTFQCEELGTGLADLRERGLAWILGGWQIEVDELPRFGDKIQVSTWCYDSTHTHALRCFAISDASGNKIVRADSQWFVFDFGRGRATRVPEDQSVFLESTPRLDMAPLVRKIKPEGEGTECAPVVATEQNLDTNGHVNNAQYVLFAADALAQLGHRADLSRLVVQYRNMAFAGDTLVPRVYDDADGWVVTLTSPEGATYATVRLAR